MAAQAVAAQAVAAQAVAAHAAAAQAAAAQPQPPMPAAAQALEAQVAPSPTGADTIGQLDRLAALHQQGIRTSKAFAPARISPHRRR